MSRRIARFRGGHAGNQSGRARTLGARVRWYHQSQATSGARRQASECRFGRFSRSPKPEAPDRLFSDWYTQTAGPISTFRELRLRHVQDTCARRPRRGPGRHDDSISLAPLVDTIRRYRVVIVTGVAARLVIALIVALFLNLYLPSERFGTFSFRVQMDGAANGQYPNGAEFSPNDIVATPVLTQVFESNEIGQYGTFAEFAVAFLIENWSFGRDVLARRLRSQIVRQQALCRSIAKRLEEEFRRKLSALDLPEYRLSFRQSGAMKLPSNVISKVLEDTVSTWARQADERKGALRYNLPVLSTTILDRDAIAREDYIIGIDILRGKAIKTLDAIGKPEDLRPTPDLQSPSGAKKPSRLTLWTLPGANSIRFGTEQADSRRGQSAPGGCAAVQD